jgi:cyclophilin family peptidyl-prolyl cis-trans isomerase
MRLRAFFIGCLALLGVGVAHAQSANAAAPSPAPVTPVVTIETTMGAIEITLDPEGAPKTTAHMLKLFRSKHYAGAAIFRVEKDFLIQLGDLDANLVYRRPPIGTVPLETATNSHGRGKVALARGDDPGSGQSSFYFELGDNAHLNADPKAAPNTTGYAVFGRVTAGMDVLDKIADVPLDPEKGPFRGKLPKTPIVIKAVKLK